jgi:hypothetical protein
VIRTKRSDSQENGHLSRLALGLDVAWPWRLASVLMLAFLAVILIPQPDAAMAAASHPKAPAKPALNVVVIGDFYSYGYADSADHALQRSAPPTLQALNQIQAANPGVRLNVLFIPVSEATRVSLFRPTRISTSFVRPALIRAVSHASVVIVGLGASNARLAASMRAVLFGGSISEKAFSRLMTAFDNGSVLRAQTALLNTIAANAAPGTSIVTLGYPTVLGEQLPSGFTWWSPYTWTAVSQRQANRSAQLVSALDTANDQATRIAAAQHSGLHFLYADLSGAMQGTGSIGATHARHSATPASAAGAQAGSLKQTIIGSALVPYVDQAANNELAAKGIRGSQNIPPVAPQPHWYLSVVLPLPVAVLPRAAEANSAVSVPPANVPSTPVYPGTTFPGLGSISSQLGGTAVSEPQAPGGGSPSIALSPLPSAPLTSSLPPASTGTHGTQPGISTQPGASGRTTAAAQPTGRPSTAPTGQGRPKPQPSAGTGAGQPAQTGTAPGTGRAPSPVSGSVPAPVIPAPPAPLPAPIAPQEPPGAATSPSQGSPVAGGASSTPVPSANTSPPPHGAGATAATAGTAPPALLASAATRTAPAATAPVTRTAPAAAAPASAASTTPAAAPATATPAAASTSATTSTAPPAAAPVTAPAAAPAAASASATTSSTAAAATAPASAPAAAAPATFADVATPPTITASPAATTAGPAATTAGPAAASASATGASTASA